MKHLADDAFLCRTTIIFREKCELLFNLQLEAGQEYSTASDSDLLHFCRLVNSHLVYYPHTLSKISILLSFSMGATFSSLSDSQKQIYHMSVFLNLVFMGAFL